MTARKIRLHCPMNAIRFVSLIFAVALTVSGCASHKNNKNDEQLRRAYAAGAASAQMQMQQNQMQQPAIPPSGDPQVRILGAVKNSLLIWSDGLTLARALVLAEYQRNSAPSSITIYRNNQPLQIDPASGAERRGLSVVPRGHRLPPGLKPVAADVSPR